MSSRARRVGSTATVLAFPWDRSGWTEPERPVEPLGLAAVRGEQARLEAVEREALARGFAQGEAAAAASAGARAADLLGELTSALQDVTAVRNEMVRRSERQMVELALALARRIVNQELSVDRNVVLAMARSAIDRLVESARVTVRLHPQDYEATTHERTAPGRPNVTVTPDPQIAQGACRVESDMGVLEAGVDAQIQEFGRALLGDATPPHTFDRAA